MKSSCVNTFEFLNVLSRVVAVFAAVSSVSMSAKVLLMLNIFCVIIVALQFVCRLMSLRMSCACSGRMVSSMHGGNTIASELAAWKECFQDVCENMNQHLWRNGPSKALALVRSEFPKNSLRRVFADHRAKAKTPRRDTFDWRCNASCGICWTSS